MRSMYSFYIFICTCLLHLTFGSSGSFYADNDRQQSVLYKPLATEDKQELQEEVLNLLGLHHRPKPRFHDTHSSAPQYLLDIYKTLEDDPLLQDGSVSDDISNRSRQVLNEADFIVSFVNKIHHHSPHLRHEKDRRFWFDVSEVPPEEDIVKAELRIYRNISHSKKLDKSLKYTLSLYAISEGYNTDSNILEPIDEIVIDNQEHGWLQLNVTGPIMYWIAFPRKNLGLYLKIKSSESRNIDPHELGIVGSKGPEELQPFMVAFFKTGGHGRVRSTRATKKKQQDSYYDHEVYGYSGGRDRYSSRRSCQRWNLYVSFRDLEWEDWIIAPDGYGAFYCHGECSFPLNANMNATNHAIVQTLVHLMDPSVVPKPCCAPTQLSAITVLYFDDNSNVILKKYKNMVVKSCGCH